MVVYPRKQIDYAVVYISIYVCTSKLRSVIKNFILNENFNKYVHLNNYTALLSELWLSLKMHKYASTWKISNIAILKFLLSIIKKNL